MIMAEFTIEEIPAADLTVDSRVQREPNPARVRRMADTWDDNMVGVLVVSHRTGTNLAPLHNNLPDQFIVLDGQTRLEAFRLVCNDDRVTSAPLLAQVYRGLTLREEAEIFLKHNDRRAVTPLDRFRIAITAREEWALDISDMAARKGWFAKGMDTGPNGRRYSAIGSLEKLYALDEGASLRRVFDMVDAAWQNPAGAICPEVINGIGLLYYRYGDKVDSRSLVIKLGKVGFNRFMSAVADRRRVNPGTSVSKAASDWIIDLYNSGRRTKRLV
jgi:hypothetical protein